jgi:hypothetical protein
MEVRHMANKKNSAPARFCRLACQGCEKNTGNQFRMELFTTCATPRSSPRAVTLIIGYPLAYALVHARNVALKSVILVIAVTPL